MNAMRQKGRFKMRIDAHVHMTGNESDSSRLMERLEKAGFDGAIVFSPSPNGMLGKSCPNQERLYKLLRYTDGQENLYPFYFIDPTHEDALAQAEAAKTAGVKGYKVICSHFYPSDERAMELYRWIAAQDMPLMFHSGILYDGINISGKYNRPCEFEPLLSIEGLQFSVAHLSWPWVDECIAVYGKFNAFLERNPGGKAAKMYLDITPGTPPTFREGALTHLFGNGFKVEDIVFWGSDNHAEDYDHAYAERIRKRDYEIFEKLGLPQQQQEKIFRDNVREFLRL